jgi:hypothetical protein
MEYGDWTDWLLCLGVGVLLGARLPMRNPEGHSPKYWHQHREALAEAIAKRDEQVQSIQKSSPRKSLQEKLWSWPVVGSVVLLFIGGGISMSPGHPYVADGFFSAGMALLVTKLLSWPETRHYPKGVSCLGVVVLMACIVGNHKLNAAWPFSPRSQLFAITIDKDWRSHGSLRPNGFWVGYKTAGGYAIAPANIALLMRIVNEQNVDDVIDSYTAEVQSGGKWTPLVNMPTAHYDVFYAYPDTGANPSDLGYLRNAVQLDFSSELSALMENSNAVIKARQPMRGWALFEYPDSVKWNDGFQLRITLTTAAGETVIYEDRPDGNENGFNKTLPTLLHTMGKVDISHALIMPLQKTAP